MFAQLVITLVTVWIIAEVLCRLLLGHSATAAVRELFVADHPQPAVTTLTPAVEPNATLRRLLADRRRKLAETGSRLELTQEAADVAEQLALRQAELAVSEGRLAEIEKRGSAGA